MSLTGGRCGCGAGRQGGGKLGPGILFGSQFLPEKTGVAAYLSDESGHKDSRNTA